MALSSEVLCCFISKIGDWTIRIDPPHGPAAYHRKHVHIRKRDLNGQYSWNLDGTRHDEHRFPKNEKCINAAKEHAASALGIPVSSLNLIVGIPGSARITIIKDHSDSSVHVPAFKSYVRRNYSLMAFGSELGLILVLTDSA